MQANTLLPWAALFLSPALVAQGGPPPIPVELRARFGFEGPLVTKIGDGIGNLQIADIDGDGRLEAVVVDSRRARLAVIRVEGGDCKVDSIATEGQILGYTLADVHGDGKADLLLVDGRGRLHVRHQGKVRSDAPIDLGLGGRGLWMLTGDLDGDGRKDVVAISRGNLRWITKIGSTPVLSAIETLEENAQSFELTDLDGDGHLDLVYVVPGNSLNVRLRSGRGDGSFGPWRILGIDNLHGMFATRMADGAPAMAAVEGAHRRVALHRYSDHGGQSPLEWWPLAEASSSKTLPCALGDLNHDGIADLVVAQPDRAQLLFFAGQAGGDERTPSFVMQTLPTLAGVSSIAIGDVDSDGKADLVLTSSEEDTLSWKPGSAPLQQFPTQLPCPDKPIAAAIAPDGSIVVLARTEKREAHLTRVRPGSASERIADLGRLQADPPRLLLADIGDAEGLEAAYVVPGEGLRTINLGNTGQKPADAAGFTRKLEDGTLAVCQHNGKEALMAVRERFVRRFRVDEKGQLQVLLQDNGPAGLTELSLAALLADGQTVFLDKKNNKLVRTMATGAPMTVDVPAYDFTQLLAHDGGAKEGGVGAGALLISPRGVLRVPFRSGPTLQAVAVHEPPTERTYYRGGQPGDFDHDGILDLAMLDGRLPGIQILAGGPDGLQRALAMPVYEASPGQEPETQPRELRVGDLNGDGRADLVLVAFDRILIYLQEK